MTKFEWAKFTKWTTSYGDAVIDISRGVNCATYSVWAFVEHKEKHCFSVRIGEAVTPALLVGRD